MKNNILIIDSDIENCEQIKYNLENEFTEVYYTGSVTEALGLMRSHPYTLVIIDILISQTNVVEFVEEVRQMNPAPILALSAQASTAEKVLAFQCGADDFLTNSYDSKRGTVAGRVQYVQKTLCSLRKRREHDIFTSKRGQTSCCYSLYNNQIRLERVRKCRNAQKVLRWCRVI